MLAKIFQQAPVDRSERKKFVPFVNERDFMGTLLTENSKSIEERSSDIFNSKNMAIIQNLKKSAKQYFFDKKYNKMVDKLRKMEEGSHKKERNYDEDVDRCFQILNYSNTFMDKKQEEITYYVDLKEELNQKISFMKAGIIDNLQTTLNQKKRKRFKTMNLSQQFQDKQHIEKLSKIENKENKNPTTPKGVKTQIFKNISAKSQLMAQFTNQGLRYRGMVVNRKLNPWKKWYTKEQIQIFPGEKITVKRLQKSIY